jgi:hypothetical protein
MSVRYIVPLLLLLFAALTLDAGGEDGFVPMFNGKDLTGWVNVNCAPDTFFVKDGMIITTGRPTGFLRTDRQYENFIAEFDWMHLPPKADAVGNSGCFVWADPIPAVGSGYTRAIEVQVLVNLEWKDKKSGESTATSHGDLFSIWGAKCVPDRPHPLGWERCIPSENRAKGAGEWNHYRIEANDGVIKLAVNGKVVSGVSKCTPRKGYLALESEGSECRFKNLKIKELPSTNPRKEEICDVAQGHRQLYNGLDLTGWQADEAAKKHWLARDTVLHYDGKGEAKDSGLRVAKPLGDAEYIVDFRSPAKGGECTFALAGDSQKATFTVTGGGEVTVNTPATKLTVSGPEVGLKAAGQWNRLQMSRTGDKLAVAINGKTVNPLGQVPLNSFPARAALALEPAGAMDFANLFVRELK